MASWLLPRHLRDPIAAIYAFARRADDLADEGEVSAETRLQALSEQRQQLQRAADGKPPDDLVFIALADTLHRHPLDAALLDDLLQAFERDVHQSRYESFAELLDYCRQSANPVGRLLLQLHGVDSDVARQQSDALCSALQLLNFLQDIREDLQQRDRIYLPQEDLQRFSVSEAALIKGKDNLATNLLLNAQLHRCQTLLKASQELGRNLRGRFGVEIRAIHAAADLLVRRFILQPGDRLQKTPKLSRLDMARVIARALFHL